jgi:hypothetical protein
MIYEPKLEDMEVFRCANINGKPHRIGYKDEIAYLFEVQIVDGKEKFIYRDHDKISWRQSGETFLEHSNRLWSQRQK